MTLDSQAKGAILLWLVYIPALFALFGVGTSALCLWALGLI